MYSKGNMRIKNINQIGEWRFYLENPEGEEVVVPPSGWFNTLQQLKEAVLSYIDIYDTATGGAYSKEIRRDAEKEGLSLDAYMIKLIEHQFCLRNSGIKCWSSGVGDTIHSILSKVDGFIEKASPAVRGKMQDAIERVTPSHSRTFGGCSVCGGSRVMKSSGSNLGRAGRFNRR